MYQFILFLHLWATIVSGTLPARAIPVLNSGGVKEEYLKISHLSNQRSFSSDTFLVDALCGPEERPCTVVVYLTNPPRVRQGYWSWLSQVYGVPEVLFRGYLEESNVHDIYPSSRKFNGRNFFFLALDVRCRSQIDSKNALQLARVRAVARAMHTAGFTVGGAFNMLDLFCISTGSRTSVVRLVDWSGVRRVVALQDIVMEEGVLDHLFTRVSFNI